jgi:chromosome condensin MukBEF ATPase and DNA-binding subunit MukB
MFGRKKLKAKISELEKQLDISESVSKQLESEYEKRVRLIKDYSILENKLKASESALQSLENQHSVIRTENKTLSNKLLICQRASEIYLKNGIQRDSVTGRFLPKKK